MDKLKRCLVCNQPLKNCGSVLEAHYRIEDCMRALVERVDDLEYELMAKKLPSLLSQGSEPPPKD